MTDNPHQGPPPMTIVLTVDGCTVASVRDFLNTIAQDFGDRGIDGTLTVVLDERRVSIATPPEEPTAAPAPAPPAPAPAPAPAAVTGAALRCVTCGRDDFATKPALHSHRYREHGGGRTRRDAGDAAQELASQPGPPPTPIRPAKPAPTDERSDGDPWECSCGWTFQNLDGMRDHRKLMAGASPRDHRIVRQPAATIVATDIRPTSIEQRARAAAGAAYE